MALTAQNDISEPLILTEFDSKDVFNPLWTKFFFCRFSGHNLI